MPSDGMGKDKTVCKTVRQYNREPVPEADMRKLLEIAQDCNKVRNYVYKRFGGVKSLSKLYPGYTVQDEMTASGLREQLGLPSVYFYLAVFDALGGIKAEWTRTKSRVAEGVGRQEHFTAEEKHYLRFLLKINNAFTAVVNGHPVEGLPKAIQAQYDSLAGQVDTGRLHRYLCRQVRKYHASQHSEAASGFSIAERAYRYADHGIYLSTKERRKRVFVPLTDNNQYKSQLYIRLYPEKSGIEIKAAVNVTIRSYPHYTNEVGAAFGMYTMLTTDQGHRYGEEFGKYQLEYADWVREQTGMYRSNRKDNPGRKKYHGRKNRMEEQLHSYINHELNRFLQAEQPRVVYIVKLPKPKAKSGGIKKINNAASLWQRGYIRKRLELKCQERSVELVEVLGKDISRECSSCGAIGSKKDGGFACSACGYTAEEKTNTARNVLNRGKGGKVLQKGLKSQSENEKKDKKQAIK